eukprot:61985-Amphidinium_carterae.1
MTDDHVISYVGIHECLSREDELSGAKKSRSFKVTPDNTLTEVQAANPQVADLTSELRVMQALHSKLPVGSRLVSCSTRGVVVLDQE